VGTYCELITNTDEAVCCDKWIRVSCDQGLLSPDKHNDMVNNPSGDVCFCNNCATNLSQCSLSCASLSCVCFNARSIVSKRFEFLPYICAHHFFVIAVTETLLDDSVHDSHITLLTLFFMVTEIGMVVGF